MTSIKEILSTFTQGENTKKLGIRAIAMFDLPGSTKLKLTLGHSLGTKQALEHNHICETISEKYGGSVIKHMGDGIFISYENPIDACKAALKIKEEMTKDGHYVTQVGISFGMVEILEIGGSSDLLGSPVDRCARLTSLAMPNQILIDQALLMTCQTHLKDDNNILIGKPKLYPVKGFDTLVVNELSTKSLELTGYRIPSFKIISDGRMLINDKMDYLNTAQKEIIEMGIGLSSFSDNYDRVRELGWKDILIELLKNGVTIKTMILDSECEYAKINAEDNNEPEYVERMRKSLKKLIKMQEAFSQMGLDNFHIYKYNKIPRFHASCIDISGENGKMSISHYLPNTKRAVNPVMQFSKSSNPKLFSTYQDIIEKILSGAIEVKRE